MIDGVIHGTIEKVISVSNDRQRVSETVAGRFLLNLNFIGPH